MASLSTSISTTEPSFTVHVFIKHDPNIASIFLPSSYAGFPESLFNPPSSPEVTRYYYENRDSLGCYELPSSLPASTPLSRIHGSLATQFGITGSLQAFFTIFPQSLGPDGKYPLWHERRLPPTTSIAEAWTFDDPDTREQGKLHLVLFTTAAAVREITGVDFLAGRPTRFMARLTSFNDAFGFDTMRPSRLMRQVRWWRHCRHALAYLSTARTRREGDEIPIEEKITEFEAMGRKAKEEVERMAWEWDSWIDRKDLEKVELTVDQVEEKYQEIREKKREIVEKWRVLEAEKRMNGQEDRGPSEELPIAQTVVAAPSGNFPSQADSEIMGEGQVEDAAAEESAKDDKKPEGQLAPDEDSEDKTSAQTQLTNSVHTVSLRDAHGALRRGTDDFTLTSGILLWSQMLSIYYATLQAQTAFTNNAASVPPMLPDGTIKQYVYTYKSAARNGRWKVRRAYSNYNGRLPADGDPTMHFGWVYCHEDLDPLEVVKRCRSIGQGFGGISNGNEHVDKDVHYIGRYDWSHHWHSPTDTEFPAQFAEAATGAYFMALDADGFGNDFAKVFADQCPLARGDPVERVFRKEGGERFGAYVSLPRTEYEFGWLVFSGRKHARYKEADELVAIVYDGMYEVLEGSEHAVENDPE